MNESSDEFFPIYLTEVRSDIKLLKYFLDYPKFERDQELIFQMFLDKYKSRYCPSTQYQYFSDENKLEYCYLRVEIDGLLEKAESHFSDFLSN